MRIFTFLSIQLFVFLTWGQGHGDQKPQAKKLILSETLLNEQIQTNPPGVQQIESSFYESKQKNYSSREALGLRLDGDATLFKSKERLLSNFDGGVTLNATTYSLGLVQPTKYGIDVSLKTFGQKITNAFISGASTTGVTLGLTVDLFQNFLGRKVNLGLRQSALGVKRAELEKKAGLKNFETNLRKIYWSLVANQERRNLLGSLVETAEKQLNDAIKRKRSGVADSGEEARFQSQLSSRKSNLLSLNYQRGELYKSLKQLLPNLNNSELELGSYSVEDSVKKVFECIEVIKNQKQTPMDQTPYDEIVESLLKEEQYQQKVLKTYNDPTIKLVGEFSNVGRDFGLENARQNLADDPRARTSIGLIVSVPLDGSKTRTKEATELAVRNKYLSMAQSNLARVEAFHSETIGIIDTLREILKNQKKTNEYLGISLNVSRKKFNQGRISLQELISEQDSFIQTKLNEIDSNLTIVNTLLDYFSIYTDTPCDFNRISI